MKVWPLVDRFPGGKNRREHKAIFQQVWSRDEEALVVPFLGGAKKDLPELPNYKEAFFGEADLSLLAIYQTWLDERDRAQVAAKVREYQQALAPAMGGLLGEASAPDVDKVWAEIKALVDRDGDGDRVALAAASLAMRKLTFGGVVRENKEGALNVKASQGQIDKTFPRWKLQFPPVPPVRIHLSNDWQKVCRAFERSTVQSAIAHCDPPYYDPSPSQEEVEVHITAAILLLLDGNIYGLVMLDQAAWVLRVWKKRKLKNFMTPCYPGHDPQSEETFWMGLTAMRRLIATGRCQKVIYWNYDSRRMNSEVYKIATEFGFEVQKFRVGKLAGLNMSRAASTPLIEACWVLAPASGRMVRQLSLLEAA